MTSLGQALNELEQSDSDLETCMVWYDDIFKKHVIAAIKSHGFEFLEATITDRQYSRIRVKGIPETLKTIDGVSCVSIISKDFV